MHKPTTGILAAILLTGCANKSSNRDTIHPLGDSLSKTTVYVQAAQTQVHAAEPFTRDNGKLHLAIADENLKSADSELVHARQEYAAATDRIGTMQDQLVRQSTTIDAYRNRWVGDKTFVYLRWIIGGWVAFGLLGSVLLQFGGGGAAGIIGNELVRLLPFVNPFRWLTGLMAWMTKKNQ